MVFKHDYRDSTGNTIEADFYVWIYRSGRGRAKGKIMYSKDGKILDLKIKKSHCNEVESAIATHVFYYDPDKNVMTGVSFLFEEDQTKAYAEGLWDTEAYIQIK